MPYKKRYKKKKRKGKANKALKLARFAVSLASKTKKRTDFNIGAALVAADTIDKTLINGTTASSTESGREGNTIVCASFHIKLEMFKNSGVDHNFLKIWIIVDQQTNSADPIDGDLQQSGNNLLSSVNRDYIGRFKILYSKFVSLNTGASTARIVNIYKKVNITTRYDGDTNLITSVSQNPIFLLMQSDNQLAQPTVAKYWRLCFYDQ